MTCEICRGDMLKIGPIPPTRS